MASRLGVERDEVFNIEVFCRYVKGFD